MFGNFLSYVLNAHRVMKHDVAPRTAPVKSKSVRPSNAPKIQPKEVDNFKESSSNPAVGDAAKSGSSDAAGRTSSLISRVTSIFSRTLQIRARLFLFILLQERLITSPCTLVKPTPSTSMKSSKWSGFFVSSLLLSVHSGLSEARKMNTRPRLRHHHHHRSRTHHQMRPLSNPRRALLPLRTETS